MLPPAPHRYWHYLAHKLGDAVLILPPDFAVHVINAFHTRAKEMDVPLLKLALFLDPKYRKAAMQQAEQTPSGTNDSGPNGSSGPLPPPLIKLMEEAGLLGQRLGFTKEEVDDLFVAMGAYAFGREPFGKTELGPVAFWACVGSSSSRGAVLLATLAMKLRDVKPTAATPEQVCHQSGLVRSFVGKS